VRAGSARRPKSGENIMSLLIGTFTIASSSRYCSGCVYQLPDFRLSGYYGRRIVTLGAAVAATLMAHGTRPILASFAAFGAGMVRGRLHWHALYPLQINSLLSGILVMTALYSINLHIMGQSNVPYVR